MSKGDFTDECNRTACNNKNAVWYNSSTLKYYCHECAHEINKWNPGLCSIIINLKYRGEDNFGRPVFKDLNSRNHYGSTNRLVRSGESKEEIIKYFRENTFELCYFGTHFNCEPNGGMPKHFKLNIVDDE